MRGSAGQALVGLLVVSLVYGAGATAPAFVSAADHERTNLASPAPSPSPSSEPSAAPVSPPSASPGDVPSPAPTSSPVSTHGPRPSATAVPAPTSAPPPTPAPTEAPPGTPPGQERVDLRSANSRTFEQPDGSFISEFYAAPIFWRAPGLSDWQPIDTKLRPANDNGVKARSEHAPAQLDLAAGDNASGFAVLHGGGHVIRFRLPAGTSPGRAGTPPVIQENGLFADYADFLPGGIGLRIFPHADGFSSFIVLPERPATNIFALEIEAPGLALVTQGDGSIIFVDQHGDQVGRIPRPYMVDSSELEGRGGGLYSDAVTTTLTVLRGPAYLLTLTVDPDFLDSAVYPVYLDPSPTDFPGDAGSVDDTFASQRWPTTPRDTYQRPTSPYYHEMWHGLEPGTSYYNEVFIRFNGVDSLGGVFVESATLDFYPYWQYYHNDPRKSYWQRITGTWDAASLTWNTRPAVNGTQTEFFTTEGEWSGTDVTAYVQGTVNGDWTDQGLKIHNSSGGQGMWKRIVSSDETGSGSAYKPHLTVVWHALSASPATPTGNVPNGRTLTWSYANEDAAAQTGYWVQVSTSQTIWTTGPAGTIVRETAGQWVTSGANNWTFDTSGTAMNNGTSYWWRVRVREGAGYSAWSSPAQFTYDSTAPNVDFANADEGTTTPQSASEYISNWIESDTGGSGTASRSVQQWKAQVSSGVCPTSGWAPDGPPVASTSGYVDSTYSEGWSSVSSRDVTMPSTIKVGDQLLALVIVGRDQRTSPSTQTAVTPPEGWNLLERDDYLSDPSPSEYLLYEKLATADDAGTQTWAVSPDRGFGVYIVAYRGLQYQRRTGPNTRIDTPVIEIALPDVALAPGQVALGIVGADEWYAGLFASVPSGWTQRLAVGARYYLQPGFLERTSASGESITGPTVATTSNDNWPTRRIAWTVVLTPALAAPEPLTSSGLTSGNCYRWINTLTDRAGNSVASTSGSVLIDSTLGTSGRGEESYYTRVPFDLGGGWRMAVGVHNGELTLDRHLFEIPSYGPPQSLSLSYSSLNSSSVYLGTGWSSNLTQYLTFTSGTAIRWNRPDGGIVPFTLIGSTWTPSAGHFETLTSASGEYTVTLKDQTRYVFEGSGAGRLKRIENRFGKALIITWNTTSATATDASGRTTDIAIPAGLITTVTDSAGRPWSFGYAPGSTRLVTITDPEGNDTTLGYDQTTGQLISVTRTRTPAMGEDAINIVWGVAYSSGKVSGITDPVNSSVANTFSYNGSQTTVGLLKTYSAVRSTWIYTVDASGRVTSALDPEGYTTTLEYDAVSNMTKVVLPISTSPVKKQTISNTFDARGNLRTQTTQLKSTTYVVTAMTYNTTNDLLSRTQADNDSSIRTVTTYSYDQYGRLTRIDANCTDDTNQAPDPPADPSNCQGTGTANEAFNLITTYSYTAQDQIATEAGPCGADAQCYVVTKHVYDTYSACNATCGYEIQTIQNCTSSGTSQPSPASSCTAQGTHDADTNVTTTYAYEQLTGLMTSMTDPLGSVTTYSYDLLGRPTTTVLPGDGSTPSLTTTTVFDELGNALTQTDAWNGVDPRTTTFVYDAANRLTSSTDPNGVESTTVFDAAGNALVTVAAGVTTTRSFDHMGRVTCERLDGDTCDPANPPGAETTYAYDGQGRQVAVTDPEGVQTTHTFDLGGRLTASSTGASTSSFTYDRLGRKISSTAPDGTTTQTTYDRLGRVLKAKVLGPNLETNFTYDRSGNQTAVVAADNVKTSTDYDQLDRPTVVVSNDVPGSPGPGQDVTSTTTYDRVGSVIASTDPLGHTTASVYDDRGNRQAVMDPLGTVTRFFYDGSGSLTKTIVNCTEDTSDPQPPTSSWWECDGSAINDGTWNVTTTRTYDESGHLVGETAPNGRVTEYVYDDTGRQVQRIDNAVSGTPAADEDISTYFAYDESGRQSAVRTPTTNRTTFGVTRYIYDDAGRLVTEIRNCTDSGTTPPDDPAWQTCSGAGTKDADTNLITSYEYDDRGNRVAIIAADPAATTGTSTATVTTRYAYDSSNRLCGVLQNATTNLASPNPCATSVSGTASSNVWTRYVYDTAGNMVAMVDARGHTTHYGYDATGRLVRLSDPVSSPDPNSSAAQAVTTSYSYDNLGRRTGQSERGYPSQPLVTWTYYASGLIATRVAGSLTTTYQYDDNGNQTQASTAGSIIDVSYDRLNRPLEVTVYGDSAATTSYDYDLTSPTWTDPSGNYVANLDAFDRERTLADPIHGGASFIWTYRADGQLANAASPDGNTTTFGYDDAGAPTSRVTANGGIQRAAYNWTLNRFGQILSESSTVTNDPTNGSTSYSYDSLARLLSFNRGGSTSNFGWQGVPNRSSVQVDSNPAVTTTYSAGNQPSGTPYDSDSEGRLTARQGQILVWDDLGRLTQVRDSSQTPIVTYTYDALDRLLTVSPQGSTAYRFRYVGLTTQIAQTAVNATGSPIRNFANDWSGRRLFDWTGTNSDQHVYGTNGHGDVTWLADSSGSVVSVVRYDPWGNTTATYGSYLPEFRFQGSWYDATTDLSWVVTRWYAPALGRFVSEDAALGSPMDPPSRHLYAYAAGDPVGRFDRDGRASDPWARGGKSTPQVKSRNIANRSNMVGTIRIVLFIAAAKVCTFAVPIVLDRACLAGDARGFSGPPFGKPIDCVRARACINVDFDHKLATLTVNKSCHWPETNECLPALKIGYGPAFGSLQHQNFFGTGDNTNYWEALWGMCPSRTTIVSWSLKNSLVWISPTIDGTVEAWRCGDTMHIRYAVNHFPSVETFYFVDGQMKTSWRHPEPNDILHGSFGLSDLGGVVKEQVINLNSVFGR